MRDKKGVGELGRLSYPFFGGGLSPTETTVGEGAQARDPPAGGETAVGSLEKNNFG